MDENVTYKNMRNAQFDRKRCFLNLSAEVKYLQHGHKNDLLDFAVN